MSDSYDDYELRIDLLNRKEEIIMADLKTSKQLVRVVAVEGLESGVTRVVVKYDRIDEPKTGMSAGNLKRNLDKATAEKVKALKPGDEVVLVKQQSDDGKYWNLHAIEEASTFKPREKKEFFSKGGSSKSSYDDTGVKVGASRNQAIAFLAATQGNKFTLDDVDAVAMEIVARQARQEEEVRSTKLALPKDVAAKLKEDSARAVPVDDDWGMTAEDEGFFE